MPLLNKPVQMEIRSRKKRSVAMDMSFIESWILRVVATEKVRIKCSCQIDAESLFHLILPDGDHFRVMNVAPGKEAAEIIRKTLEACLEVISKVTTKADPHAIILPKFQKKSCLPHIQFQ